MRRPRIALLTLAALCLSGCAGADPPEEGTGNQPEVIEVTESVLELNIGDCVMDRETPLSADLASVPTVPCGGPHDSELYAIVTVTGGTYPGVDDLVTEGQSQCQVLFGEFVGIDFRSSTLDFHFYYPTPSSWMQGDRGIYCMVSDPGLTVVGTLQGAKR